VPQIRDTKLAEKTSQTKSLKQTVLSQYPRIRPAQQK
jgi:hypothetical protein